MLIFFAVSVTLICLFLIRYALKQHTIPGAISLSVLLFGVLGYGVPYLLQLSSPSQPAALFWYNLSIFGANLIGPAWLVFSLSWTGRLIMKVNRGRNTALVFILMAVPLIVCAAAWTNPLHHLYAAGVEFVRKGNFSFLVWHWGLFYWIGFYYAYLLAGIGLAIILLTALERFRLFQMQSILLIVGGLLPVLLNIDFISGLIPIADFDLAPFAMLLTCIIWSVAIFRLRFLSVKPIAHKSVFDKLPVGMIILDTRWLAAEVNPAAAAMLGLPIEQVIGRPLPPILAAALNLPPSLIDLQPEAEPTAVLELNGPGNPMIVELGLKQLTSPPADEVVGVVVLMTDITWRHRTESELFESRQRLQNILDAIPQRVFWKDANSIYLGCNRAMATDAGLECPEDIAGKSDYELPWAGFAPAYIADDQMVISSEQPKINYEEPLSRPDGSISWVRTSKVPLYNQAGKVSGLMGTYEDITDRRNADEMLRQANEKLRVFVRELEQRNSEASLVHEMDDLLQAVTMPGEAYEVLELLAPRLFPQASGALCLLNESAVKVEVVAHWGGPLKTELAFKPDDCWTLRRGQPHHWNSALPGLRCKHIAVDAQGEYLEVPMLANGKLIGMFHLESANQETPIRDMLEMAGTISARLAITLTNISLREKLQSQSIRDPLTNLFNRRFMEEYLSRELTRANRSKARIGLILLDIDHFKGFNDTYGHNAGDEILRALGRLLQTNIRGGDIACRLGGEEFVLILPETDQECVTGRAEQICQAVREMTIHFQAQPLGAITVSIGVAVYPDHAANAESLIISADRAMYRSKNAGRDRVTVAG